MAVRGHGRGPWVNVAAGTYKEQDTAGHVASATYEAPSLLFAVAGTHLEALWNPGRQSLRAKLVCSNLWAHSSQYPP